MLQTKKIRLAVLDWAGTTVDYGSMAPADVFHEVFQEAGIHLNRAEINGPMGKEKKEHIRALLSLETAKEQWKKGHGADWTEADVERLYAAFEHTLAQTVASRSTVLADVPKTIQTLRERGILIGSTTGYTSQIMGKVLPVAKSGGYSPDTVVTPDITGIGRPSPFMLYECMRRLNVYPPSAVVKIGDTLTDIREGKNAGAFAIGLLTGSNLLGLTKAEAEAMNPAELASLKEAARLKYAAAGADLVVDCFRELPDAIAALEQRLQEG